MIYWNSVKHLFWHNSDVPLLFHSGIFFFIFSIFLIGYALVAGTKNFRNYFIISNTYFGTHYSILELVLPIGISFYTFQSISFLVDTYKRKIPFPAYSEYLMYMSFFPHLFAGPIVRAADFLPQASKKISLSK